MLLNGIITIVNIITFKIRKGVQVTLILFFNFGLKLKKKCLQKNKTLKLYSLTIDKSTYFTRNKEI